jgi:hypothetical protein
MPSIADLVHESATTTGTGNFTLSNINGKQPFNTAFGTGGTDLFYYYISNRDAAEWELGTGHLSASSTLVRDTVILSTNANAAVSFSAGTKDVTNALPASLLALGGWSTGDVKATMKTTADTGWVLMNDGTIGNASSGGTTRANADTVLLFTLLWNNTSNTDCAVSGGRGASAAADYAANKTIALPKTRGRGLGGAGAGSTLTSRALAATVGAETHTLSTPEIPGHTHTIAYGNTDTGGGGSEIIKGDSSAGNLKTSSSTGGGGAHNNMQPTTFINWMIKL